MLNIPGATGYDKVEHQALIDVADTYYINAPDGWIAKLRFLDLSEMIYVTKGNLRITVNKKNIELSTGDAYLIRRYATLSGGISPSDACSFYTVSFLSTVGKYDCLFSKVIPLGASSSNAESLLNQMYLFSSGDSDNRYLTDSAFLLLLETVFSAQKKEPERVQMNGIIAYINDNISSKLSIEEIGQHFHYSSDYIAKIFKEQFGITPKQYIVDRKLSIAKHLLTTSDLSVRNIASALGFEDSVLFEKFFKYHAKMTPRKYRNLYT